MSERGDVHEGPLPAEPRSRVGHQDCAAVMRPTHPIPGPSHWALFGGAAGSYCDRDVKWYSLVVALG